MKLTTIYLDENKIEISNSILGLETVKVNNEVLSEKFSIFGTNHKFKIVRNEKEVDCEIFITYGRFGINYSLYVDNKPIIESPKSFIFIFYIVIFTALSVIGINHLLVR